MLDKYVLKFFFFILVAEMCWTAISLSRTNDYCRAHGFAGVGVSWQDGFYCRAKQPHPSVH